MELRRVADTLLRCHTSPLLNTSLSTRTRTAFSITCRTAPKISSNRSFTSSGSCSAIRLPTPTTSSAPEPEDKKSNSTEQFKSLWSTMSTVKPLRQPRSGPPAPWNERRVNGGYSDADMQKHLSNQNKSNQPVGLAAWKGYDMDNMIVPGSDGNIASSNLELPIESPPKPHPMRLTPSIGRTVTIAPGVDVGRAFSLLAQTCARNAVRRDFGYQRFHERPGMKRKRLRRMRWRKSFMDGFQAAVGRVTQLKKQGW